MKLIKVISYFTFDRMFEETDNGWIFYYDVPDHTYCKWLGGKRKCEDKQLGKCRYLYPNYCTKTMCRMSEDALKDHLLFLTCIIPDLKEGITVLTIPNKPYILDALNKSYGILTK